MFLGTAILLIIECLKTLSHAGASLVCANFLQAMGLPWPQAGEVFLLLVGGKQAGRQDFLGSELHSGISQHLVDPNTGPQNGEMMWPDI